jgi:hypothetical protein
MRNRDPKLRDSEPMQPRVYVFFGLLLIATGTLSLLTGKTHYRNVWGAPVFAPFVIFGGLLALIAAFKVRKR